MVGMGEGELNVEKCSQAFLRWIFHGWGRRLTVWADMRTSRINFFEAHAMQTLRNAPNPYVARSAFCVFEFGIFGKCSADVPTCFEKLENCRLNMCPKMEGVGWGEPTGVPGDP